MAATAADIAQEAARRRARAFQSAGELAVRYVDERRDDPDFQRSLDEGDYRRIRRELRALAREHEELGVTAGMLWIQAYRRLG